MPAISESPSLSLSLSLSLSDMIIKTLFALLYETSRISITFVFVLVVIIMWFDYKVDFYAVREGP